MRRRKDTRRSSPELKLHVEALEPRRLMNADLRRPRPDHAAAPLARALESLLASRSDADLFARELARHPRLADNLGLGGLALVLRRHTGDAARHGWGAFLAHALQTHPRYAAAHHLTSFATPASVRSSGTPVTPPFAAASAATLPTGKAPAPAATSAETPAAPAASPPVDPPIVVQDPQTVAIGATLDVTLPNLGDSGATYTITPQPLPAHMTFNRDTGALTFAPALGQAGTLNFSVAVSSSAGSGTILLPVTVTNPAVPSTEVSGQVVDEDGQPMAGMPVAIGAATAVTDQAGDFTLTGVPANPGPISAGGSVAEAEDRLALTAPVPQLLGHAVYLGVRNVIPTPLIVPKVDWSSPAGFSQSSAAQPLDITNPAMAGFDIHLPASIAAGAVAVSGSLSVAELPASLAAQHLPPGVSGGLVLYQVVGSALPGPVQLTLPNHGGYAPGAVLALLGFNALTGGHDVIGHMVVSGDGKTMTSSGFVTLNPATAAASAQSGGDMTIGAEGAPVTQGCIAVVPTQPIGNPDSVCAGCQATANGTATPPNGSPPRGIMQSGVPGGGGAGSGSGGYSGSGSSGSGGYSGSGSGGYSGSGSGGYSGSGSGGNSGAQNWILDSDAGLVTGEYFLDHQLVPYQAQGQAIGVDLQYSSGHADPTPVVQYQFTTPYAGDSADISSINAQVSLAGVSQGDPTTYDTPNGLTDGQTYNIPLQVDASALPTGVYPYTMTLTENFGVEVITSITTTNQGYVNVVNDSSSPYGAGWSLGGLQHLAQVSTGGPVLITAGQQGTEAFDPVYANRQADVQDLGLATSTSWAQILANDGAGGFSASESATANIVGTAAGDFTGDGLPDLAVVSSYTLAILLDNGSGGFTAGNSYAIPSGYEAKAVAVGNFSGHAGGTLDTAVLLAATSGGAYSVAEYTGNGSGGFATPVISAAGNGTASGTAPDSMIAFGFTDGGDQDLAFTTDNGLADVMAPTSGGSFGSATSLAMPAGHDADGVTTADVNGDGHTDLIVEAANTNDSDGAGPFASLDLFDGNGSGSFTEISTDQTVGHPHTSVIGLVAGDFQGASAGLEVAVPVVGDSTPFYLAVVPLSSSGTWGGDALYTVAPDAYSSSSVPGDIIAADLNGAGKPSLALTNGGDQVYLFLADPASNQFLPEETLTANTSGTNIGVLAAAPFMRVAATPGYRGPTSDPSTLVNNDDGTWTRTYPDGTVIQFNSSGQETSEADRNGNTFRYAYVTSGAAAGAVAKITDPVGLVTTLTYNASGDLSTVTDPANRVSTITVDSSDDLTEIEDPDGAETRYTYASNHEAASETNADGKTATPHYNSFGQLTSETLFDGTSTTAIDPAQSNGLLAPGHSGSLPTTYQASITDPDGHTITLVFNWMSHPTEETDANGGVTTMTYDRHGFVASVTDPLNRTTTYTHDAAGDVTSIAEYELEPGQWMGTTITETIAYNDLFGVPTSITDFNGNLTSFTLDTHGNVLEQARPGGVDEHWTYNTAGQPLTFTDADGNITVYSYNTAGRLAAITEPLPGSPEIHYAYDTAGDVTAVTDAVGDTTTMTYDPAGRLLTEENPVQAAAGKDTAFGYDDAGNLINVTDANGGVTTSVYDARNKRVSVTDPMGRTTTYGYDAAGNRISVTDPMNRVTSDTYDNDNNAIGVTDPMGGTTSYAYDQAGEITSMTDPNGFATTYMYDSLGRLAGESRPVKLGFFTEEQPVGTFTYDNNGNRLTATDANDHTTSYAYNALNEETSATNADGDETQYSYNGDGEVVSITDGLDHATNFTYDALGDVLTETQPTGGGTTTMTYDGAGDRLSVTDPDGNVTSYTSTAAHQVATETTPTSGVYTYTYDVVGNLTQSVDPDGHTIQYAYNANNQVTTETWVKPGGGSYDVFTDAYNADGQVTSVSDNSSAYQYGYNADGEVTSVSDAGTTGLASVTLDYGYDADGNRTSLSDSLGGVVSYTYDARDELVNETLSGAGITPEAVALTYDGAGNLTGQTRYSDLTEMTVVASTSDTYDPANQLTGITDKNASGTTLVSYGYTYDAAGRVTQEGRVWNSGATTDTLMYGYTNNNQLTSVTHTNTSFANEGFAWDANGNQTGTGYTTSTGNEQTASPGYTFTYDADGNTITATNTSTHDVWTYSYNFAGQMTDAVEKTSGGTLLAQATYTYDALGNRIGFDDNGTQTWTLYDGLMPIMDFTGSGSLAMRYLNDPAGDVVDTVLARESAGGTVSWYLPDRLGTIRDLLNNTGSIIDHVDYSAFGTQLDESSPSNGDRMMGFAGLVRDTVTGLNLAVRRVQDPASGRWTSQDPGGFSSKDTDFYRYCSNAPSISTDVQGLDSTNRSWLGKGLEPFWGWWGAGSVSGAYAASHWGWIGSAANGFGASFQPRNTKDCDYSNAARHALWQALMAIYLGGDAAESIGNAHEFGSSDFPDSWIDQYNNEKGRQIGKNLDNVARPRAVIIEELEQAIRQAIEDGVLIVCKNDPRIPPGARNPTPRPPGDPYSRPNPWN